MGSSKVTLTDIVRTVSRNHGLERDLVDGIIREAIEEIALEASRGREVKIRGLGTLHWKKVAAREIHSCGYIPEGWKLRFTPSRKLRTRRTEMTNDEGMTKYGVELDEDKTKEASSGSDKLGSCPACQRSLDDAGACPVHGTEPLEPPGQ